MTKLDTTYDVIVIGAGVAGTHAAHAAGKEGARTLLLTSCWDTAACLAWGPRTHQKTHGRVKVRLGMNREIVRKATLYRGAVEGKETILLDEYKYQGFWREKLERQGGLTIFQDTCHEVIKKDKMWQVGTGWGVEFHGKTLIMTLGTFLGASVLTGRDRAEGGRPGEKGSSKLAASLLKIGAKPGRNRRTADPIISAKGIQWRAVQNIDEKTGFCSVSSRGGRKVFLEPTGPGRQQFYLRTGNDGKKDDVVWRQLPGLEKVEVIRSEYSVVHKKIESWQLQETYESSFAEGLFFAGQVIGAKDYVASASQGIVAGKSANQKVSRET
ncbi:MAG TPA: FAD-binding protein [Actinobacteria bacterium]|nr:FAD-binding protein [Actinomycetota bacterium]